MYANSEVMDHMSMVLGFHARFMGPFPRMVGPDNCESLFTRLKNKKPLRGTSWFDIFWPFSRPWEGRNWEMFIGFQD